MLQSIHTGAHGKKTGFFSFNFKFGLQKCKNIQKIKIENIYRKYIYIENIYIENIYRKYIYIYIKIFLKNI